MLQATSHHVPSAASELLTERIHPQDRARTWIRSLAKVFGALPEGDPDGPGMAGRPTLAHLTGSIASCQLPGLTISKVAGTGQSVMMHFPTQTVSHRRRMCIVQTRGATTFGHGHSSTAVSCGEVAFLPVRGALSIATSSSFEYLVVDWQDRQPWEEIAARCPDSVVLSGRASLHRLIVHLLQRLADEALPADADYTAAAVESTRSLMEIAFREAVSPTHGDADAGELSRAYVEHYIEHNLHKAQLSVADIAKAMRCSNRRIYRVFGDGTSVENISRYMWRRRVERCAEVLRNGSHTSTLTQLANSFGFSSCAHFSRVFKQHMGVAPLAFKRGHAARAGAK